MTARHGSAASQPRARRWLRRRTALAIFSLVLGLAMVGGGVAQFRYNQVDSNRLRTAAAQRTGAGGVGG
jgi:hypothetical protein